MTLYDYNGAMKSHIELRLSKPIPVRLPEGMREEIIAAAIEDGEPCMSSEVRRLIRIGLDRKRKEKTA